MTGEHRFKKKKMSAEEPMSESTISTTFHRWDLSRKRRRRQSRTIIAIRIVAKTVILLSVVFSLRISIPLDVTVYAYVPNTRISIQWRDSYKREHIILYSSKTKVGNVFLAEDAVHNSKNNSNDVYDHVMNNEFLQHDHKSLFKNIQNNFTQENNHHRSFIKNGEIFFPTGDEYSKKKSISIKEANVHTATDDISVASKVWNDTNGILSDERILHAEIRNTHGGNISIKEKGYPTFLHKNSTEEIPESSSEIKSTNKTSIFPSRWISNGINKIFNRSSPNVLSEQVTIPTTININNITDLDGDKDSLITDSKKKPSLRRLWRRRHARTLEEGIRRERTSKLSSLMNRALIETRKGGEKNYVERSLMGLITGLAEEIEDLDIELNTITTTPIWRKEVEEIRINFSRLGFRPIRIGGTSPIEIVNKNRPSESPIKLDLDRIGENSISELIFVECADEGFDRIDEDKSGTLDSDELANALNKISGLKTDQETIEELASDLVTLYDKDGDGVVDREEYKQMVDDMAKLRDSVNSEDDGEVGKNEKNPFYAVTDSIQSISQGISKKGAEVATGISKKGVKVATGISKKGAEVATGISRKAVAVASAARDTLLSDKQEDKLNETEMGSIVLSKVNLDLRRLVFGALPIVKKITPGGPLILEPFTATVNASFSREDVMESFLVDDALKRLVARALRVRVRSFRDLVDGALFFGRQWKMTCETAPVVEVLGFENVEFDTRDKLIITGRARIRASPDAPVVTNTFKLRTKIGTRKNGQVIKLVEPELAFVFKCPATLEKGLISACKTIGLKAPQRPDPYYSFFPIYSPFKVDDDTGGFDMGEDNCLRSVYIRNGKLRFELSVVLRPGRFLGNHYLAFTLPQRTFIITMDRVWNGVRAARENKKAASAKKLKELDIASLKGDSNNDSLLQSSVEPPLQSAAVNQNEVLTPRSRLFKTIKDNTPKPKSFYARFVEGYTMAEREEESNDERITYTISDWFGRQGKVDTNTTSSAPSD